MNLLQIFNFRHIMISVFTFLIFKILIAATLALLGLFDVLPTLVTYSFVELASMFIAGGAMFLVNKQYPFYNLIPVIILTLYFLMSSTLEYDLSYKLYSVFSYTLFAFLGCSHFRKMHSKKSK